MSDIWNKDEPDPEQAFNCSANTTAKGFTKLMRIVANPEINNDIDKFEKFISGCTKEYINHQNSKRWTAVHIFCRNSKNMNLDILRILIEAGADINLQTMTGWTALMIASRYTNENSTEGTVEILIKAGANLNIQNKSGNTALMLAARHTHECSTDNTVKMLVDANANLDLQDNDGCTSLMHASHDNLFSTENTVTILVNAGSNVNSVNYHERFRIECFLNNGYNLVDHIQVDQNVYQTLNELI